MNRPLLLLALCQGLLLVNNIALFTINGLVGLQLAPYPWMATLPIMGYLLGGAIAAPLVAHTQTRWGRRASFQIGLAVALVSALVSAWATQIGSFWLLMLATVVAGYYYANGQLYRFAAAELTTRDWQEKAVSLVLAGGIVGGFVGPMLTDWTRSLTTTPFVGAYLMLVPVALVAIAIMAMIEFPSPPVRSHGQTSGRSMGTIMRQPVFIVATMGSAVSFAVMNLLMAATPLAMDVCGFGFSSIAIVFQWHVVGMYAPGFVTGHLIKRFGVLTIMGLGVALNLVSVGVALSGVAMAHFLISLTLLGIGWNFLFTGSTALALRAYQPEERDRAEAAINFFTFVAMGLSTFAAGALVTTSGWNWLNSGSLPVLALMAAALVWLALRERGTPLRTA